LARICIAPQFSLTIQSCRSLAPQSPDAKLAQITELAAKSKGNVITLDDATYSYYAVSKPRPYTLVVFLTAAHPKFKCSICKQIDNELTLLAESYAKAPHDTSNPVFFLRLDYESSQSVFQKYGVTSVPLLFHMGPQMGAEKAGTEYDISARDRFQVPPDPDAESLATFLADRANVSITIERSKIGSYLILLAVFAILAALVQPMIHALPTILMILQWKPLWMAVSCGVYTCAISGLIYDIIRSPQM
jgi:oligosaccharyltransferase complex subunit gamma